MRTADVDGDAVRDVMEQLGPVFRTKEISTHPTVVAAHPAVGPSELNPAVGRYLSWNRTELHLECLDDRPDATWRKIGG